MPNSVDDIAPTLERGVLLQQFNKEHLGMGVVGSDSILANMVGVRRHVAEDGTSENITLLQDSYFRKVVREFEQSPVAHYFNLTIEAAMALPADQWYYIRDQARKLPDPRASDITQQLLGLIREMMELRQIQGG